MYRYVKDIGFVSFRGFERMKIRDAETDKTNLRLEIEIMRTLWGGGAGDGDKKVSHKGVCVFGHDQCLDLAARGPDAFSL